MTWLVTCTDRLPPTFRGIDDRVGDRVCRRALDQISDGTGLEHLQHGRAIVMSRQRDHLRPRRAQLDPGGRGRTATRHPDVDERNVGLLLRGELDRIARAPHRADADASCVGLDEHRQHPAQRRVVIGDQDTDPFVAHGTTDPSWLVGGVAETLVAAIGRCAPAVRHETDITRSCQATDVGSVLSTDRVRSSSGFRRSAARRSHREVRALTRSACFLRILVCRGLSGWAVLSTNVR